MMVKIRCFGEDLHISWDNMVFLWGICLLPEKIRLFFSIFNKYLPIVALSLEVLCRIIEYPAKRSSSEFIYGTRTAEFLGKRIPSVLISGKRIWEKSSLLWQKPFRAKQVNQCPEHGDVAKKEHLFYRTSPIGWFCFRTEKERHAFEEEENEILQRNIEENSNNIA